MAPSAERTPTCVVLRRSRSFFLPLADASQSTSRSSGSELFLVGIEQDAHFRGQGTRGVPFTLYKSQGSSQNQSEPKHQRYLKIGSSTERSGEAAPNDLAPGCWNAGKRSSPTLRIRFDCFWALQMGCFWGPGRNWSGFSIGGSGGLRWRGHDP